MAHIFPAGYQTRGCYLVPIDAALLPYVAGLLRYYEQRAAWASEQDYEQGYNAFAELEACMTKLCAEELIESNRQIYRLLDSIYNGTQYTLADDDPLTIYPVIPPVPNTDDPIMPGMRAVMGRVFRVLDNGINGTLYNDFQSSTAIRNQLATIIELLQAQENADNTEVIEQLQIIAGALV